MTQVINGFVLAGGKSSRMGQDKALIELGGTQFVLRAAQTLSPFVGEVTLLGPPERYANLGLPVIADRWPEQGPLAALYTGLLSLSVEWGIFLACDLPLVSQQFIELLVQRVRVTAADAVVPRTADGWQPLSAAYHGRCRTAFARALQAGERSVIKCLDQVRVEAITRQELENAGLGELEFTNVNTPEDLERLATLRKAKDHRC